MKSIVEALRAKTPEGNERLYRVKLGLGEELYVVANSPGQAALSCVTAERVTDKEIATAYQEADRLERKKEDGDEK